MFALVFLCRLETIEGLHTWIGLFSFRFVVIFLDWFWISEIATFGQQLFNSMWKMKVASVIKCIFITTIHMNCIENMDGILAHHIHYTYLTWLIFFSNFPLEYTQYIYSIQPSVLLAYKINISQVYAYAYNIPSILPPNVA